MVASSSADYQGPKPMDIDRVQDAKGPGKTGKNDHQKGKGKDTKGKGKKGKEGDQKGKSKRKDQKGKGAATCYTCGKPGHLAKDCWRDNIRQVASDPAHSSSRGAPVTTHTVGQQQANVSEESSSAETKPAVTRIENSGPIIFDAREGADELEDHGIRVIGFYIRDDDDDDDDDQQIRGAGIGSHLSPALCNVAITLIEHSWQQLYNNLLHHTNFHFNYYHYVDNRSIVHKKHFLSHPAIQTLIATTFSATPWNLRRLPLPGFQY